MILDWNQGVAAPLHQLGKDVAVLPGSITDAAFVARLVEALHERPVGALVHAAGVSPTMGDAELMFAVNFDATGRLVQAVLPRMAQGSCAVLIASSSGYAAMSPQLDAAIDAIGLAEDSSALRPLASLMTARAAGYKRADNISRKLGQSGDRLRDRTPELPPISQPRNELTPLDPLVEIILFLF